MTETQIVDDFVAKYGKLILSAPTAEGFDLVAWTLPVIALLAGLIVVYGVIFKWTRRKPVLAQGQGGAAIPEEYQNRLERELKDLD
jgi:cytochrome c-type biogenesis protein CcmH/NrfF